MNYNVCQKCGGVETCGTACNADVRIVASTPVRVTGPLHVFPHDSNHRDGIPHVDVNVAERLAELVNRVASLEKRVHALETPKITRAGRWR